MIHCWIGDVLQPDMAEQSVDLVLGSPPYLKRRDYGIDAKRDLKAWVRWMGAATLKMLTISRGPVVWIANGCVEKGHYQPAVEGLMWELHNAPGVRLEHPLIWSKNATPNRKDWWCNGWEYVMAFCHADDRPRYFDWEAVATPQKYANGGGFRQRHTDGSRTPKPAKVRAKLARPYDIIRATVGGGHMGHDLAHDNEAPFPESLVRQIIPALCPPGGTVLDPFGGSGTTACVAHQLGRIGISMDIRISQCVLATKRSLSPQYQISSDGYSSAPPLILASGGTVCLSASTAESTSATAIAPNSTTPDTSTAEKVESCTPAA